MFHNKKGQTAIELIIVTVLIITASTMIIGKLFQVQDSTIAMATLKSHALNAIEKENNFYYIKKIENPVVTDETFVMEIKIGGSTYSEIIDEYLQGDIVKHAIANNTLYNAEDITIQVVFSE